MTLLPLDQQIEHDGHTVGTMLLGGGTSRRVRPVGHSGCQDWTLWRAGTYRMGGDAPLIRLSFNCAALLPRSLRIGELIRLLPDQSATFHSRRFISGRLQFLPIGHKACKHFSDRAEYHSTSTSSLSHEQDPRARMRHAVGSITQGLGNV